MSHQRANSTSSISSNSAFDTHHNSNGNLNHKYSGGMATDSSSAATASAAPLSISIPRQRSFSTSLSLANSPRTFTGSSIIANPSNGLFSNSPGVSGSTTPFASAFGGPLSPTTASAPNHSNGGANPSTAPVLHRRFSSSFNQLNQIASPSNSMGSQANERGRRASFFGGASPQILTSTSSVPSNVETNKTSPTSGGAGGLFRKFSTTGRSAGHPFDRNDTGPAGAGPQPNSTQQLQHQQKSDQQFAQAHAPTPVHGVAASGNGRLSAIDKLKPSQDKHSRSSSPMRSMILNGQMLD
ncbi:hypothetical protein EDD21DRAFT_354612 [Dissophora ornata]|nr:hypothetical protein BGZ58_009227 [Dissophora ornata]KAI8600381.1 hypothetical protein EDD21DRAFT_354612 [Dissophora ornata]